MSIAQLRDEAADWVVQLDDADRAGQGAATRAACSAWRKQSPEHDAVFLQCQRLWQSVAPEPRPRMRRRVAAVLAPLLVLGALSQMPWKVWTADAHAPADEIRQLVLEDGSRLTLNRGAAVDLVFSAKERSVRLIEGEVYAEVAHDAARRPFRVSSRDGVAQARGTRYLVRQDAADTTVTVLESVVNVMPAQRSDLAREVKAGEQLRFDARQIHAVSLAPAAAGAWTQRRLVFEDAPLVEVIAALNREHAGWLRLSGDGARQMRFTGVLPADDSAAALALLQRALPLQTRQFTQYLQWVEARSE